MILLLINEKKNNNRLVAVEIKTIIGHTFEMNYFIPNFTIVLSLTIMKARTTLPHYRNRVRVQTA